MVDEDFKLGRLKRKSHDYLCSNSKGKWGCDWSDGTYENFKILISNNEYYIPKITCKSCLKIMERFKNK